MDVVNKQKQKESKEPLRIPLDFEETLTDLLKIKPVENTDLKKPKTKKKSKLKK